MRAARFCRKCGGEPGCIPLRVPRPRIPQFQRDVIRGNTKGRLALQVQ